MRLGFDTSGRFEAVRQAHRSERAPDELRRRLVEHFEAAPRSAPAQRSSSAVAARFAGTRAPWALVGAGALAIGVWAALRSHELSPLPAESSVALVAEPTAPGQRRSSETVAPSGREPAAPAAPAQRPCPLQEVASGAFVGDQRPRFDFDARLGTSWHTLQQPTPSCGPLERYYVQLRSSTPQPRNPGPILILIHDTGKNVNDMWVEQTRWYFDALASDGRAIVVLAHAAPGRHTVPAFAGSGGWQTDDGANPQVDDLGYLSRVLEDMQAHGVIAGQNPVWLIGQGGGAALALKAAALHPELYSGVVALAPSRLDLPLPLPAPPETRRLRRVMFIMGTDDVWAQALSAVATEWAVALGVPTEQARRRPEAQPGPIASIRQIDFGTPDAHSARVRILSLAPNTDLFPPPGGADALTLAASRARPDFVNGAEEIWAFFNE